MFFLLGCVLFQAFYWIGSIIRGATACDFDLSPYRFQLKHSIVHKFLPIILELRNIISRAVKKRRTVKAQADVLYLGVHKEGCVSIKSRYIRCKRAKLTASFPVLFGVQ